MAAASDLPIVLVDVDGETGHRYMYLEEYASILLEHQASVSVLCSRPVDLSERIAARVEDTSRLRCLSSQLTGWEYRKLGLAARLESLKAKFQGYPRSAQATYLWLQLLALLQKYKIPSGARILLMLGDSYLTTTSARLLQRLRRWKLSAIYMFPFDHEASIEGVRRHLLLTHQIMRSSKLEHLFVLDERLPPAPSENSDVGDVVAIPDICSTSTVGADDVLIDRIREFAKGRRIILVIGGLAKRKGLLRLLKAAQQIDADDCVVAIGKLLEATYSQEELTQISALSGKLEGRFYHHADWVSDQTFNACIEASSVVYLCYEDFPHSSNVLAKAAFFRVPVLVNKGHLLEYRVDAYELGQALDEGVLPLVEALNQGRIAEYHVGEGSVGYYQQHNSGAIELMFKRLGWIT